jgi:hypothetical protein
MRDRETADKIRARGPSALRTGSYISVVACICTLAFLLDCRDHSARWAGKISQRNGIVLVENPADPIYRHAALSFQEELSIGSEEAGDEYLFSDIRGLDADDEGRIYIIDAGREIFVVDYVAQGCLFFSLDGMYLRRQHMLIPVFPIRRDSRGKLIGMEILAPPPLGGKIIRAYGPDLRPLFDIAKEEQGARGIFDIGKPARYCVVKPDDSIVWGDSKEYVLYVLDSDGRLVRRITKPYRSVPISSEDQETFKEQYSVPIRAGMKVEFRTHFPAFSGIFTDDAGRVLVKTYERFEGDKDSFYFDVFDPEGRFSAKIPIRVNIDRYSLWKGGKLFTQETDPEGIPKIKRYKVIWDNEIH